MKDEHLCHEPRCKKPVPPEKLACSQHWFALPIGLRRAIRYHYRPGQEITKDPSTEYLATAFACVDEWDRQCAARTVREGAGETMSGLGPSGVRAMKGYTAYCGQCNWWGGDWVSMSPSNAALRRHAADAYGEWMEHIGSAAHTRLVTSRVREAAAGHSDGVPGAVCKESAEGAGP